MKSWGMSFHPASEKCEKQAGLVNTILGAAAIVTFMIAIRTVNKNNRCVAFHCLFVFFSLTVFLLTVALWLAIDLVIR